MGKIKLDETDISKISKKKFNPTGYCLDFVSLFPKPQLEVLMNKRPHKKMSKSGNSHRSIFEPFSQTTLPCFDEQLNIQMGINLFN